MARRIRLFLTWEALIFFTAALIHFGVFFGGYRDQGAGTAEGVIGGVLLLGLILSLIRPDWTPRIGLIVQGFALLGTFVGVTLLLTVGPRMVLDIVIHLVMVVILIVGLVITARARPGLDSGSTG